MGLGHMVSTVSQKVELLEVYGVTLTSQLVKRKIREQGLT